MQRCLHVLQRIPLAACDKDNNLLGYFMLSCMICPLICNMFLCSHSRSQLQLSTSDAYWPSQNGYKTHFCCERSTMKKGTFNACISLTSPLTPTILRSLGRSIGAYEEYLLTILIIRALFPDHLTTCPIKIFPYNTTKFAREGQIRVKVVNIMNRTFCKRFVNLRHTYTRPVMLTSTLRVAEYHGFRLLWRIYQSLKGKEYSFAVILSSLPDLVSCCSFDISNIESEICSFA